MQRTQQSLCSAFDQQVMPGEMCQGGEGWRANIMQAKAFLSVFVSFCHVPGEPPMGI